jgi:hypothetical protein
VVSLSPDIVTTREQPSAQMGDKPDMGYYSARIAIDMDEFNAEQKRLNLSPLTPGMPVDVNIIRGTRTLLRYLLDPVTDNMFKAFKEK